MFRIATPGDAEQAIEIIRRSIEDLCIADHRGDQDILRLWLANKRWPTFEHGRCLQIKSYWLPSVKGSYAVSVALQDVRKSP
jgi:hypothetical protein